MLIVLIKIIAKKGILSRHRVRRGLDFSTTGRLCYSTHTGYLEPHLLAVLKRHPIGSPLEVILEERCKILPSAHQESWGEFLMIFLVVLGPWNSSFIGRRPLSILNTELEQTRDKLRFWRGIAFSVRLPRCCRFSNEKVVSWYRLCSKWIIKLLKQAMLRGNLKLRN